MEAWGIRGAMRAAVGVFAILNFVCVDRVQAQELPEIPQTVELKQLIRQSMSAFSDAVIRTHFDKFRDGQVCNAFLEKTTAKQMEVEFKPFIEKKIDLSAVKEADVILDGEPTLSEDVLRATGHFETQPMQVLFDLAYMRNGGKWLIYGITVGLKKSTGGAPAVVPKSVRPGSDDPSETTAAAPSAKPTKGGKPSKEPPAPASQLLSIDNKVRALITGTLLDFNTAIQRKDFTEFLGKASPPMQKQTTPEKLKEAYALFIKEGVDISAVGSTEPRFREPPVVKNGTILTVKGYYQIAPLPVLFEVDYFKVSGEWKVLGLSVQTISPTDLKSEISSDASPAEGGAKKPAKPATPEPAAEGEKPDPEMKKEEK